MFWFRRRINPSPQTWDVEFLSTWWRFEGYILSSLCLLFLVVFALKSHSSSAPVTSPRCWVSMAVSSRYVFLSDIAHSWWLYSFWNREVRVETRLLCRFAGFSCMTCLSRMLSRDVSRKLVRLQLGKHFSTSFSLPKDYSWLVVTKLNERPKMKCISNIVPLVTAPPENDMVWCFSGCWKILGVAGLQIPAVKY